MLNANRIALCLPASLLLCFAVACGSDPVDAAPAPSGDVAADADGQGAEPDVPAVDVGKPAPCTTAADCAHPGTTAGCGTPICSQGLCANESAAKGTPCSPLSWFGGVCEEARCDGAGSCVAGNVADGTGCGDAACGEICQKGVCKPGASADDGDPCTVDQCKQGVVSHTPVNDPAVACDDGNPCTEPDGCVFGACVGKTATCHDGVSCTVDFCDAKSGCVNLPSQPMCEDGDPCTKHSCDAEVGCVATGALAGAPCDDGNPCTVGDGCSAAGQCVGGTNTCECTSNAGCADGDPCTEDVCASTGKCQHQVMPDCPKPGCKSAADCDDGDKCTADACVAGNSEYGWCKYAKIPECG